jgi:NAD(P)-dependent dehydrogenase (short-subunit alcohol dehydrogenase family)
MTDPAPRHAIVTGSSPSIGAAITVRRPREDWRVTGLGRTGPGRAEPGCTHRAVHLMDGDALADAGVSLTIATMRLPVAEFVQVAAPVALRIAPELAEGVRLSLGAIRVPRGRA